MSKKKPRPGGRLEKLKQRRARDDYDPTVPPSPVPIITARTMGPMVFKASEPVTFNVVDAHPPSPLSNIQPIDVEADFTYLNEELLNEVCTSLAVPHDTFTGQGAAPSSLGVTYEQFIQLMYGSFTLTPTQRALINRPWERPMVLQPGPFPRNPCAEVTLPLPRDCCPVCGYQWAHVGTAIAHAMNQQPGATFFTARLACPHGHSPTESELVTELDVVQGGPATQVADSCGNMVG
jgi:hypothetical protein